MNRRIDDLVRDITADITWVRHALNDENVPSALRAGRDIQANASLLAELLAAQTGA